MGAFFVVVIDGVWPVVEGGELAVTGDFGRPFVGDGRLSAPAAVLDEGTDTVGPEPEPEPVVAELELSDGSAEPEAAAPIRLAFIRSARARTWSGRIDPFAFLAGGPPLAFLLSPNISLSRIVVARDRAAAFFSVAAAAAAAAAVSARSALAAAAAAAAAFDSALDAAGSPGSWAAGAAAVAAAHGAASGARSQAQDLVGV